MDRQDDIMKISERKHRLRRRGVVPVAMEAAPRQVGSSTSVRARNGGAAVQKAAKPRWQPGPRYQITFGLMYLVFAPILFLNTLSLAHAPKSKYHPGLLELGLPVVFFLFGVWWLYRGVTATRRARVNAAAGVPVGAATVTGSTKTVATTAAKETRIRPRRNSGSA